MSALLKAEAGELKRMDFIWTRVGAWEKYQRIRVDSCEQVNSGFQDLQINLKILV